MTDKFISPCPLPEGAVQEGLTILSEEGAEISEILAQVQMAVARMQIRGSKAKRFGLDEIQPGQDRTNSERLAGEIGDLIGVVDLLCGMGVLDARAIEGSRAGKASKLAKYMQNSLNV